METRFLLAADFGDAPLPYPAASHEAIGPMLGALRDAEAASQPTALANGDGADDDGVTFSALQVGQLGAVQVNVESAPSGAKVDAWIDFNGDGHWGGADEQILDSAPVVNGSNVLAFNIRATAASGLTYARVRLTTAGDLGMAGAASDGEVEDYAVNITSPVLASGLFASPATIASATGAVLALHAADLDRDGDMDVVAAIGPGGGFGSRIVWYERIAGGFSEHTLPGGFPNSGFTAFHSLDVADLNGDGRLDIIFASLSDQIYWYESDGLGQFTQHATGATIATPRLVTAMDVNGDGHLDLVTTRRLDTGPSPFPMVWFENNGSEQFTTRRIGSPATGFNAVAAADFDQNGVLDFLSTGSRVEYFANPHVVNGASGPPTTLLNGSTSEPLIADMDSDGDLDIVLIAANVATPSGPTPPTGSQSVVVMRNFGGAFSPYYVGYVAAETSTVFRQIALGDVDGDGDVDIVGPGVWMENVGGMSFDSRPGPALPATRSNVIVADMDGDGDLDALSSLAGSIVWSENKSVADVDFGDAPAPYDVLLASGGPFHGGGGLRLGATRDAEADGAPSAAADADAGDDGVSFGELRVGDASATVTVNVQNTIHGGRLSAWVDFNGDGVWAGAEEQIFADVAVDGGDNVLNFAIPADAVTTGTFARFRLSTAGSLEPHGAALDGEVEDYAIQLTPPAAAVVYELILGSPAVNPFFYPYLYRAADLDGDSDLDFLYRNVSAPGMWWAENLGGGSYLSHAIVAGQGSSASSVTTDFQAVDYDSDGDMDIVAAVGSEVGWLENNGEQSFAYRPLASFQLSSPPTTLQVIDMDGDGDIDVLPMNSTNPSKIWWLRNEGGYNVSLQSIASPTSSYWGGRAVDMDGDGDVDLAIGGTGLYWLENDGLGAFTAHAQIAGAAVKGLVAADLDRDGDMDLVVQFEDGAPKLEWLENTGADLLVRHTVGPTGATASSGDRIEVADLDGDGDLDIVLGEHTVVHWHRNDGQQNFSVTAFAAPANEFASFTQAADLNGDGDLELITSAGWYESRGASEPPYRLLGAGNANNDDTIDGDDFLIWQRTLGQTSPAPGAYLTVDWDRSGAVDAGDLEIWRRNFGAGLIPNTAWINSAPSTPALTGSSVPAVGGAVESAIAASVVAAEEPTLPPNLVLQVDLTPAIAARPRYTPPRGRGMAEVRDAALVAMSAIDAPPSVEMRSAATLKCADGTAADDEALDVTVADEAFATL